MARSSSQNKATYDRRNAEAKAQGFSSFFQRRQFREVAKERHVKHPEDLANAFTKLDAGERKRWFAMMKEPNADERKVKWHDLLMSLSSEKRKAIFYRD